MSRTPIPKALKWHVFERDRFTCRYCGATGVPLEADHVFPESKGGPTVRENLVAACEKCNRDKRDRLGIYPLPVDYLERLAFANKIIGWYQAQQEKTVNEEANRRIAEKIAQLEKWFKRRQLRFKLIKALSPLSFVVLLSGIVLVLLGLFIPSPILVIIGEPLPLVAIGMSWIYPRLMKRHVKIGAEIPDF